MVRDSGEFSILAWMVLFPLIRTSNDFIPVSQIMPMIADFGMGSTFDWAFVRHVITYQILG
jgi:hypothetical protein